MSRKEKSDTLREKHLLQWHPAFYAGIQIEFGKEAEYLDFEQEYPLGTKPKMIDVLIKKPKDRVLKKNIGRIFRTHNIIEYKAPGDYLSIDDYYKVFAYTYFYKSHAAKTDTIKFEELTVSLISESYPAKLIRHLKQKRHFQIQSVENGIYYILGDTLPVQIIVTRYLSAKENLWFKSLTNRISDTAEAEALLREYQKHQTDARYKSMMDIIVRANETKLKEMMNMCEALEKLMEEVMSDKMKEELEAKKLEGERIGEKLGQASLNELILKLSSLGRLDDIVKSASDSVYQEKLFKEFGL